MKRTIAMTILGLLLGGVVLSAHHQGKSKKDHGSANASAQTRDDGARLTVTVAWTPRDVEIIRRYYADKYRYLPPGQRKKLARTGQLSPGWQKKMKGLPASLERDCSPLPTGYRRGVIDAHAVIYNGRGAIFDVTVLY